MTGVKPNTTELLPLGNYDHILVSLSGGKDSVACVLHLLELGIQPAQMELWHQHVDGDPSLGEGLMDWPVTSAYVRAMGEALGIPVRFQWRDGGLEREMLRKDTPTGGVCFEDGDGKLVYLPTKQGKKGTRWMFPQTSMDLSVRWCSPYIKIDVFARAINNDPRFKGKKVLVVTGERRQEGKTNQEGKAQGRAAYAEMEKHRCSSGAKRVDAWRAVIDWPEEKVWDILRRHRVSPHPAYQLGFGRVSCLACIFGDPDQWASVRELAPERFTKVASYEEQFGKTIRKGLTVIQVADKGKEFVKDKDKGLIDLAMGRAPYTARHFFTEGEWTMPAGAFKRCGGPG